MDIHFLINLKSSNDFGFILEDINLLKDSEKKILINNKKSLTNLKNIDTLLNLYPLIIFLMNF